MIRCQTPPSMGAATRRKLQRAFDRLDLSKCQPIRTAASRKSMIDDMQGLYSHASDAYRAGKRTERQDFYDAAQITLAQISARHETAGNVEAFRAAEECCKALRELKARSDAPKKEG